MSVTQEPSAPPPLAPAWEVWLIRGLLFIGLLNLGDWLVLTVPQVLRYPYGIDFGEGLLWNQVRRLLGGENIYGPITNPPYIVSNYPPGIYLLNALLQWLAPQFDPLLLGRSVSVAGTLAIIAALFALVRRYAFAPHWTWLLPLAWLFAAPAWRWGVVMRVDSIGIAMTLWGLVIATSGRPWIGAPLWMLAAFTKHSLVAAPLAWALSGSRFADARRWLPLLLIPGLYLAGQLMTGGGLLQHIVGFTANEFRAVRLLAGVGEYLAISLPLWGLWGLVGLPVAWQPVNRPWTCYLALSTATLVTFAATGSDSNYYLEPLAALLAAIIVAAGSTPQSPVKEDSPRPAALPAVAGALPLLLIAAFAATNRWGASPEFLLIHQPARSRVAGDQLVQWLHAAEGPILSEEYTFLLRADKFPDFQPYIFRLLAESGKWDESPILDHLQEGGYDYLVLRTNLFQPGNAEEAGMDRLGAGFDRLTTSMEQAIKNRYEIDPRSPVLAESEWYLYRKRLQ